MKLCHVYVVAAWLAAIAVLQFGLNVVAQPDPSFDHQTTTYVANNPSGTFTSQSGVTITSFFSPDTSIQTFTNLIKKAQTSIDISTPSFSSWSGCTQYDQPLIGCPAAYVRNQEAFPVFQALLNAIIRGVQVRILTNNFEVFDEPGMIDPMSFLCVAGAQCKYFTTLTFLHTKTMLIDGKVVLVSSVNFSYTSFMKNREAGVVITGPNVAGIYAFYEGMFTVDWNQAITWTVNTYNSSVMEVILDKTPVTVTIPAPLEFQGAFVTNITSFTGPFSEVIGIANPDNAWNIASTDIQNCQKSLNIYIYQITTDYWCNLVLQMYQNAKCQVNLLVSNKIFDKTDSKTAAACYATLTNAGLNVQTTAYDMYTYSHQKYWVIDNKILLLSSGNMGDTDFPDGSNTFPPYGNPSWRRVNRDHSIKIVNSAMATYYNYVMMQDYALGQQWSPSMDLYAGAYSPPQSRTLRKNAAGKNVPAPFSGEEEFLFSRFAKATEDKKKPGPAQRPVGRVSLNN